MNERKHWTAIADALPAELSPHAKTCIGQAISDGRIESPERLRYMPDVEIMWGVRGASQINGIGKKTLQNVRTVYPRIEETT